jgi:hypothetical protein
MFKLILAKLPTHKCRLIQEEELWDSQEVIEFEGVLQEVSTELALQYNGGITHNLYVEGDQLEEADTKRHLLNGYNNILIEGKKFEIIKVKKVEYKEGGHIEMLLARYAD